MKLSRRRERWGGGDKHGFHFSFRPRGRGGNTLSQDRLGHRGRQRNGAARRDGGWIYQVSKELTIHAAINIQQTHQQVWDLLANVSLCYVVNSGPHRRHLFPLHCADREKTNKQTKKKMTPQQLNKRRLWRQFFRRPIRAKCFLPFVSFSRSFLEWFKHSFDLRIAASSHLILSRLICSRKSLEIVLEVTRLIAAAAAAEATALKITPVSKSNNRRHIKWSFNFLF